MSSNIFTASGVCRGVSGEAVSMALAGASTEESQDARLLALFDRHHERLYRLARRLAPTRDDARDLVQDTFLRILRAPGLIPPGVASEEAWLVRILVNLQRDQWRRHARRRLATHHQTSSQSLAQGDHESAIVARSVVWRALDGLPPRRRAAIVLYELEGADISRIAKLLGISAITVRWHLSQGRRELARIIASQERGT